jgi:hypothetical protein
MERRIFVVGVPRSGTTLVQSLLAAHGSLTSYTESHFFSRYFRPLRHWPRAVLVRDPRLRVRDFLRENCAESEELAAALESRVAARLPRYFLPLGTWATACQLVETLDALARHRGYTSWVEKTPRHLRYLAFLERLPFEGLHFVHVVRRGLDTVASLMQASRSWERAYDLQSCVRRWNAEVEMSLERASSPRDHVVLYEELTSRPQPTLERLLTDLGLTFDPAAVDRLAETLPRLVTPSESWKSEFATTVRPSPTGGRTLGQEQSELAARLLRDDLYERLKESSLA